MYIDSATKRLAEMYRADAAAATTEVERETALAFARFADRLVELLKPIGEHPFKALREPKATK